MALCHSHGRPKWVGIVLLVIGGLAAAVALGFVFGAVVMWLWNTLMPTLFGLKLITYWQGVGLVILGRLLLGSFGANFEQHHKEGRQGRCKDRGDYNAWWKDEGQQAFAAYLARQAAQAGDGGTPDAD
jgi:hypothetical protein